MASNYVRLKFGNYAAIGIKNNEKKLIEVEAASADEALEKAKKWFDEGDITIAPVPAMVGVL